MNKLLVIFTIGLLLVVGAAFVYFNEPEANVKQTYNSNGEITKIVYEITSESTLKSCQNDCAKRGGYFEECGNPCDPGAEVCEAVCAVTCTFN